MPNGRKHDMRCAKCYAAGNSAYWRNNCDSKYIIWRNISFHSRVITGDNDTGLFRCNRCGHIYRSKSNAAQRIMRHAETPQ
jgi:hypothetical protein